MLRITVTVDSMCNPIGVKEALAMYLERYGDVKSVRVEEIPPQQLEMKVK